jgi:flagellin
MPTVDLTRIGSNIGALYSLKALTDINNKLADAQQKLSTGKRINSAADDPAGLVIATKMNARSVGLKVVQDNISDATNMMSVAESGLNQLTDIVTQMRSKATQAANDTLGATERAAIQTQLEQYSEQIDDILAETKWNGVQLLSGDLTKQFQTGVDAGETTTWNMSTDLTSGSAGLALSSRYNSSDVTASSIVKSGSGFTNADGGSTIGSNQSQLTTGGYTFKVLAKSSSTTAGSATISDWTDGVSNVSYNTSAAEELASGDYTVTLTDVDTSASTVSYTVSDGTNSWSVSNASASSGSLQISGSGGSAAGLTFEVSIGSLDEGSSLSFEYINSGEAKIALYDASGLEVSIDQDGSGAGTTYGSYAYAAQSSTYASGRGVSTTLDAFANITVGDSVAFDYHRAGNYVVDVSSAAKASSYVSAANTALDTINSQLATLGSLMARMNIKSDAASSAQINVEAAYNRIMNANMAEEQVNASKYQVLQQTSTAMLAQSNQAPQAILSLFQ